MDPIEVDLLSVFISAFVYIILGWLWYSPWLFGKIWMTLSKIAPAKKKMGLAIFMGFINALVLSFFLALLMSFLRVNTAFDGLFVGFGIWLGFVATTQFSSVIWAKKPFKLYLIDNGFWFIAFSVLGMIMGA